MPSWLEDVKASYTNDPKAQDLFTKLAILACSDPHFTLHQGLLRYKGRIWIGSDLTLQHKILEAFHCSAVGGHSGFPATYHHIKRLFAWTGLKSAVHLFVTACPTCQQAKPNQARYPVLLQPLAIPTMA